MGAAPEQERVAHTPHTRPNPPRAAAQPARTLHPPHWRSTLLPLALSPACTRANIASCVLQHHPCMHCLRAPALTPRRPCHPPRAQASGTARGSSGPTRRSTCAPSIAPAVFNATIIAAGVAHRRRRRSLAASTKRHRPSRSRSRSVALAVALAGALAVAVAVCLGSGQSPWPCAWEVAKWP